VHRHSPGWTCNPTRPGAFALILFNCTGGYVHPSASLLTHFLPLLSRTWEHPHAAQVYIRGASIRFYVVPDMLAQAPMFKRAGAAGMKGRGIGTARGRATIMRAQSRRGRGGGRPAIRR
jgi:hypothetical protein